MSASSRSIALRSPPLTASKSAVSSVTGSAPAEIGIGLNSGSTPLLSFWAAGPGQHTAQPRIARCRATAAIMSHDCAASAWLARSPPSRLVSKLEREQHVQLSKDEIAALSGLLDQGLDLPENARGAWIEGVSEPFPGARVLLTTM